MESGTILMTSLNLNHLLTGSVSNIVTLEGGLQHVDLGSRIQSIEVPLLLPTLAHPHAGPKDPCQT